MKAILMAIALLVIGFVLLIKGADYFVDGSSAVAKKLKVPSLIIGFTIVAMLRHLLRTIMHWQSAMQWDLIYLI